MTKLLRILLFIALAGLLVISLTGMLSFAVWQSEMITPFRPQLLFVAVVGLGFSLGFKNKYLIGLAILAVVCNALPMATRLAERKLLPATSVSANPARHVSLVFSNVLWDNQQYDRVITMVEAQNPDLFIAVETTPDWIEQLSGLKARYPYSFTPPHQGLFGISVYAKKPFKAELIRFGPRRMPMAQLEFDNFVLIVGHPMPPARKHLVQENRLYLDELARRVQGATKPVILAGDLNATLWSHNMQPLIKAKMQWPQGSGLAYSWPTGHAQMAIQIDHVLTKGAVAGTYRVLPNIGSDHFPVRAEIDME